MEGLITWHLPRWAWAASISGVSAGFGVLAGIDPRLAILGALGLGFLLLVLADLTIGLALFAFLSYIALVPTAGTSALSFLKLAGGVLALSWLATMVRESRDVPNFMAEYPGLSYCLLLFLGWVALSQIWAEQPSATVLALSRYALNAILFLIILSAVRERKHVIWVLTAMVAGAAVSAIYGLLAGPTDPTAADRLSGTIGNPNELAAVLVVGAAVSVGLGASARRSPALRLAAFSAAALCVFGVLLTLSRTGLVAMGVAIIASVALSGRWRGRAALAAVTAAFIAFGYFSAVASPQARQRVTDLGNGTGRVDLWQVGRRMVAARPFLGVGAGNFPISSIHYLLKPGPILRSDLIVNTPKVAHNTYLEVLAELGIPGFVLFLIIPVFSLRLGAQAIRNFRERGDSDMEVIARALIVALIGLLAADFFASAQYHKQLWLLLGLCPALLAISRAAPDNERDAGAPLPAARSPQLVEGYAK